MQLRALQFVCVCRENLEINESEVLLSLPSLLRFKSDSTNWPELSLSEFSLSFALSILDIRIHICTHAHARTRAFGFSRFIARRIVDTNDCQTEAGKLSKY